MGNLNRGESDYPNAIDDYIDEVDAPKLGKTSLRAATVNGVMLAIKNVQTELGTNPAGSKTDVAERIDVMHESDGSHIDGIRVVGANDLTTIQDAIDDLPVS